jgi:hypothetical protein
MTTQQTTVTCAGCGSPDITAITNDPTLMAWCDNCRFGPLNEPGWLIPSGHDRSLSALQSLTAGKREPTIGYAPWHSVGIGPIYVAVAWSFGRPCLWRPRFFRWGVAWLLVMVAVNAGSRGDALAECETCPSGRIALVTVDSRWWARPWNRLRPGSMRVRGWCPDCVAAGRVTDRKGWPLAEPVTATWAVLDEVTSGAPADLAEVA